MEHGAESKENKIILNTQEDFLENKLVQHASIRNLEVIGEVAKNLSSDLKEIYPEIE